jgi:hypothetical protein
MPLANDETTITIAVAGKTPRVFTLRASLRAAITLYNEHGSYSALAAKLAAGSFSACRSIIKHCCTNPDELWRFEAFVNAGALHAAILENQDDLIRFVQIIAGADPDSDNPETTGKPMTFDQYHERLFEIGTGWLSWTPEATWNATKSEILAAYRGRMDMLKAIFGKADDTTDVDGSDPNARAALNALGDLGTKYMSEVPNAA